MTKACKGCGMIFSQRPSRAGYCSRGCATAHRNRIGDTRWRNHELGYAGAHKRVGLARGKASRCTVDASHTERNYHWASILGNFSDIMDYIEMCVSCHRKFDYQIREMMR